MTTRELYSSVGLSSLDLAKVGNSEFVWAVAAFANKLEKPVATFSNFDCALNLVKRLNAFVEGGVGLRPVLKTSNHLDTDKYKRLAEIGLTPYLIQLNDSGDVIQLVDNLGDDLDELSVDKLLHDLNKMDTTVRHNNTGNNLLGTFWAPNGHLAIKKARLFMAVLSSLIEKAES
ncbi:hypothetical protein MUK70_11375 [Dyadobacter chenwenxiniae]|uniref:Uncharacterized protein n=2 Tax=Dyadobacter chenwenxiniae TaxID=2906456 RepID=A0A9X1PQQ0_9BACT|nr:hypothetical protein [Dyadobacter chenwenxiniae]MCF0065672.1 hypothetical protein [Dyadobacter chenwenxiniae]UON85580.1 hypothetical protein MUK70_11375 [Dyadobacter chenwenxiniae]